MDVALVDAKAPFSVCGMKRYLPFLVNLIELAILSGSSLMQMKKILHSQRIGKKTATEILLSLLRNKSQIKQARSFFILLT